jgi:hypothetical protein
MVEGTVTRRENIKVLERNTGGRRATDEGMRGIKTRKNKDK